jgi:hypothetical protein
MPDNRHCVAYAPPSRSGRTARGCATSASTRRRSRLRCAAGAGACNLGRVGAIRRRLRCVAPVHRPRDAKHTVLHQVIALHLEAFLEAAAGAGAGAGLPQFAEREFRDFLMCDTFGNDVLARAHCGGRLRLIATLHDPAVIRKILAHLDLAHLGQSPGAAPPEPSTAAS